MTSLQVSFYFAGTARPAASNSRPKKSAPKPAYKKKLPLIAPAEDAAARAKAEQSAQALRAKAEREDARRKAEIAALIPPDLTAKYVRKLAALTPDQRKHAAKLLLRLRTTTGLIFPPDAVTQVWQDAINEAERCLTAEDRAKALEWFKCHYTPGVQCSYAIPVNLDLEDK